MPINIGRNHWVAVVLFPSQFHIQFYDSYVQEGLTPGFRVVDLIFEYVQYKFKRRDLGGDDNKAINWTLTAESPPDFPQQPNRYDCGVFVCCLYDYFATKASLPRTQHNCFLRRNCIAGSLAAYCSSKKDSGSTVKPNDVLVEDGSKNNLTPGGSDSDKGKERKTPLLDSAQGTEEKEKVEDAQRKEVEQTTVEASEDIGTSENKV